MPESVPVCPICSIALDGDDAWCFCLSLFWSAPCSQGVRWDTGCAFPVVLLNHLTHRVCSHLRALPVSPTDDLVARTRMTAVKMVRTKTPVMRRGGWGVERGCQCRSQHVSLSSVCHTGGVTYEREACHLLCAIPVQLHTKGRHVPHAATRVPFVATFFNVKCAITRRKTLRALRRCQRHRVGQRRGVEQAQARCYLHRGSVRDSSGQSRRIRSPWRIEAAPVSLCIRSSRKIVQSRDGTGPVAAIKPWRPRSTRGGRCEKAGRATSVRGRLQK